MGNDWTRLVQEAARHGGPDALRKAYQAQGFWTAVKGGLIGLGVLLRMSKTTTRPESEATDQQ